MQSILTEIAKLIGTQAERDKQVEEPWRGKGMEGEADKDEDADRVQRGACAAEAREHGGRPHPPIPRANRRDSCFQPTSDLRRKELPFQQATALLKGASANEP